MGTLGVSRDLSLQFQIKWIGELGEAKIDNIAGTASWRPHNSLDVAYWNEVPSLDRGTYFTQKR